MSFLKKVKVEDALVVEAIGKLGAANRAKAELTEACRKLLIQQTDMKRDEAERLLKKHHVVPSAGSLSNWNKGKHKISDFPELLVSAIEELTNINVAQIQNNILSDWERISVSGSIKPFSNMQGEENSTWRLTLDEFRVGPYETNLYDDDGIIVAQIRVGFTSLYVGANLENLSAAEDEEHKKRVFGYEKTGVEGNEVNEYVLGSLDSSELFRWRFFPHNPGDFLNCAISAHELAVLEGIEGAADTLEVAATTSSVRTEVLAIYSEGSAVRTAQSTHQKALMDQLSKRATLPQHNSHIIARRSLKQDGS